MKRRTLFIGTLIAAGLLAVTVFSPALAQDGLDRAIEAKERHVGALMQNPDVVGVGVGLTAAGKPSVMIFTMQLGAVGIPRALDGVPVVVRVTGAFHAINKPDPDGNHNHGTTEDEPPDEPPPGADQCDSDPKATCDRPVPIGVSTGNAGSCSAGTIGARVKINMGGTYVYYALINNHVYALGNFAADDSAVLQPGRYDTNCDGTDNGIGTLDEYLPLVYGGGNNTIDAAIALSSTAELGNATPADGYGTPSSTTVSDIYSLDKAVQKYGRTTSLTKGTVVAIDFTVNVGYSGGTGHFVDQIIVEGAKGAFIKAGDSGSLLVTDDNLKNPVGLLFAGNRSGKLAIANPIDLVLQEFGASIDGN